MLQASQPFLTTSAKSSLAEPSTYTALASPACQYCLIPTVQPILRQIPQRFLRSKTTNFSLPGIAYVSTNTVSNLTSLTWSIDNKGTVPWNVTSTSANSSTTIPSTFYIVTTEDAFSPVGFLSSNTNTTAPPGSETVGFALYGSDVSFLSGETLLSQFWAKSVGTEGTEWVIYWNVNGSSQANSVPVVLKMASD